MDDNSEDISIEDVYALIGSAHEDYRDTRIAAFAGEPSACAKCH